MTGCTTYACSWKLALLICGAFVADAYGENQDAAAPPPTPETVGLSLMDAVHSTLTRLPQIEMQRCQMAAEQGAVQAAQGVFDLQLDVQSALSLGANRSSSSALQTSVQLRGAAPTLSAVSEARSRSRSRDLSLDWDSEARLTQQLRSGIFLESALSFKRTDAEVRGRQEVRTESSVSPSSLDADNAEQTAAIQFSIVTPLLQGRGRDITTAPLRMAETQAEAAQLELTHATAAAVYQCVSAYWDCLAAQENLAVALRSEQDARQLLRDLETLVEADERPAADLGSSRADLAARSASRVAAEQNLLEARSRLALAMGLDERLDSAVSLCDAFPTPETVFEPPDTAAWEQLAVSRRHDIKASRLYEAAQNLAVAIAKDQTLAAVDLHTSVRYQQDYNRSRPTLGNGQTNAEQFQVGATLSFSYPFQNNAARGQLYRQKALRQQTRLQTFDLERTIRANIVTAAGAVHNALSRQDAARESVRYYAQAVEDETKKMRHGFSTLLDVLTLFDRLKEAEAALISAQQALGEAIIQVRYQSGALLTEDDAACRVERDWLVTLPQAAFP